MINNLFTSFRYNLVFSQFRCYSFKAVNLVSKKLISVKGEHCYRYLQGLITNDIRHLYSNQLTSVHLSCIYSLFLHPNGRIFADTLIYNFNGIRKDPRSSPGEKLTAQKIEEEEEIEETTNEPKLASSDDELFIEIDGTISDKLARHLKLHKLRSKVNITYPYNNYDVWSIYPGEMVDDQSNFPKIDHLETSDYLITVDPRLKNHYRCLISKTCDMKEILSQLEKKYNFPFIKSTLEDYTKYRWESGISEGSIDHPDGNCFPLECNGDFLHGISFHKGCYIGQELTARVHHTGVVRKRLLPIRLVHSDSQEKLENYINCDINSSNQSDSIKLGKLRSGKGHHGLGLLYVESTIIKGHTIGYIKTSDNNNLIKIETYKPFWWPLKLDCFTTRK